MVRIETTPTPKECNACKEEDCYNCDIAGKRWVLSREAELHTQRLLAIQGVKRLQQRIAAIDLELERLHNEKSGDS